MESQMKARRQDSAYQINSKLFGMDSNNVKIDMLDNLNL